MDQNSALSGRGRALPEWAPRVALAVSLGVAWINFLTTWKWEHVAGSLHGVREPWYTAALASATVMALLTWRKIGRPVRVGSALGLGLLVTGPSFAAAALLGRLPPSTWTEYPFKDDWIELFQQASNGVALLRRGVVVGWNWWFLGGYPTSTDIAQNFGTVAFVPMSLFGDRLGYHLLHVVLFLAVPVFVWLNLRREPRDTRMMATGLAGFFSAGYLGSLGASGDTNSLVGVCMAGLAITGAYAARLGDRWGGPVLLVGLTAALYTHTAFFIYAGIFLTIEAAYFRDRRAFVRLVAAAAVALVAALPAHWEALRYPEYVSFNNTVFAPGGPVDYGKVLRSIYYNVEILAFPHRWYNDYRSLNNIWLVVLLVAAVLPGRSRLSLFAWVALAMQFLLRLNTLEFGAVFDRIQHLFPLVSAPALAGFVVRCAGTRKLAAAVAVVLALFCQTEFTTVPHVPDLRTFNPPLMDRIAVADGMVLVELSPHRDVDSSPDRRSARTPFDVHFEALLPTLAGQRFYAQMIDGFSWNSFRGQIVSAGTYAGQAIGETPPAVFEAEMRRWGIRHLFVWTDVTRDYLAKAGMFVERWREGRWSHFERLNADTRSVVVSRGTGALEDLDMLGARVDLRDVVAGDTVVVRANYYPAWRAFSGADELTLFVENGQLAFRAPESGSYSVRLEYPRYRVLNALAIVTFLAGLWAFSRWSMRSPA